jgi:hypothetical protein
LVSQKTGGFGTSQTGLLVAFLLNFTKYYYQ